ncbi:histidine N-acetyltransferase-like [Mya arenaria]|nr:histidine N-acetyltransferase-like [Mya arenaria]
MATDSPSSVAFRLSTPEDKDAVLSIHGNVYEGRDYLPAYYDKFMECAMTKSYVAVLDGEIVGFCASLLVDSGKTCVSRASRVSPRVASKGVYTALKAHAYAQSGAIRQTSVVVDANQAVLKPTFQVNKKLILTHLMTRYVFDAAQLTSLDVCPSQGVVNTPNQSALLRYLTTPAVSNYLFPDDRIVVDWIPFRLKPENVPLLTWSGSNCAGFTSVPEGESPSGLLSFDTIFKSIDPPYACNMEIYGTDITTLKHHLAFHLRRIRELTNGPTSLLVIVHPGFNHSYLKKTFREFGLETELWRSKVNPSLCYSKQFVFES